MGREKSPKCRPWQPEGAEWVRWAVGDWSGVGLPQVGTEATRAVAPRGPAYRWALREEAVAQGGKGKAISPGKRKHSEAWLGFLDGQSDAAKEQNKSDERHGHSQGPGWAAGWWWWWWW